MVLISEIADEGVAKEAAEEEAKQGEVKEEEEASPDKSETTAPAGTAAEDVNETPAGESFDPTPAAESSDPPAVATGASGQTLNNEYALRVAYIMRSYLNIRQADTAGPAECTTSAQDSAASPPPHGDRCKAMMEVVRKEQGKWTVSKLALEHNHQLSPAAGGGDEGLVAPVMGMEFESVEAAKAFYYGFGEKSGFKPRTGSNRRSAGSGALIMQRFLCWRGNYLIYRKDSEANAGKRKRGPYKKRARLEEEGAAAVTAKKHGDAAEVIEVESSSEKGRGAAGDDGEVEVQSSVKETVSGVKGAGKNPPYPVFVGPAAAAAPAAAMNATTGRADAGAIPVANAAQSRLLRELGVRVYRYTEEERRDIILKYLMKRTNRQVVERPVKVPSRQASADRRQRGVGGRFLGRDAAENPSQQDERTEAGPDASKEDHTDAGGEPKVGMVFANEDKAYEFYVRYAGTVGFSVRKGWWDKSGRNVTRSRVYVCSREGFRPKNVTTDSKKPRPETRTGCPARLAIKIMPSGKYSVSEFVADHNHELSAPLDIQMLKSQRLLSKVKPGGHQNASLIPADYKNYLRSKRTKDMQMGDAGALLEYLQKMKGDNPSFFYAIQLDEDDQLTNIFWADAYSMMDYHYFGDVVCFDTTYKANSYDRPFALFIGVNHHKQAVVFGAALLYDETVDSFKWLFETFKAAMSGKQPKTILTDQSAAMSEAISVVWPGTIHRLCVWHMYQNATKNLNQVVQGSEIFATDLSQCMYDCQEEEEFQSAWETMLEKYELKDNEWLGKLYEEREKWALVYGRQTFYADIANTLRIENLTSLLIEYLKSDTDLMCFFKQYEKLLEDRRYAEKQADYYVNQGTSRIPPLLLLWQAANAYTPAVFEMFRLEFELSMNCLAYSCGEVGTASEYDIAFKDKTKRQFVRFDSADATIVCTCRKFEFTGIQCCHVLKVLDLRNIKELPPHFILKRWRKDAKVGSIRENQGFALDDNSISSQPKRYTSLCRMLYKLAARAAENSEAYAFMESQSDQLLEQVERILQARILEKPPSSTTSKGQPQNLVHESNSGESPRLSGKKKRSGDARRRQQNGNEPNKRLKGRQGSSEEAEVALSGDEPPATPNDIPAYPRDPPNQFFAPSQFVQGTYVPSHQFGLGSVQGFHGMTHFSQMQESSASALQQQQQQQQQFHGSAELSQACPAPDVHSLQFVGNNPQLGHQSSDQGHYNVPVWDFL